MSDSDVAIKELLVEYYDLLSSSGSHRKFMGCAAQPHEVIFLYGLILQERPKVIFESGTAIGWSASWMCLASDAPVYTYDPDIKPRLFSPKFKKFEFINAPFSKVVNELPKWCGFKKLFFIDGDHSSKGALEDFESIEEFLESGDIIVLHDTVGERGVVNLFKKIYRKYPNWKYEQIKTYNGMEVITCV